MNTHTTISIRRAAWLLWGGILACAPALAAAPAVWINEFHYDNTGADTGEFIEVAGVAGTSLSSYMLWLYNGVGGVTYDSISLSGTLPNEGNGFGSLSFAAPSLQNGSPDGFALYDGSMVLQFLSYEGTFTAAAGVANGMTSQDVGVDEDPAPEAGMSLQLTGVGDSYGDFTWSGPATASLGSLNAGQSVTVPEPRSGFLLLSAVCLGAGWRRWRRQAKATVEPPSRAATRPD